MLRTSTGDFPLDQYRLKIDAREWKIFHVSTVLSRTDEQSFLRDKQNTVPYGLTLWASSIALAYEVASRETEFRGQSVLELGSGTGLPGIVAASQGARVMQTDRSELVMSVCRMNVELNEIETIEQQIVDWTNWEAADCRAGKYEWIIGSDILYGEEVNHHLRRIFETNLAPDGKVLLSDPFREVSIGFLETLEKDGWQVSMSKWSVGEKDSATRPVGIFELTPPLS